MGKNKPNFPVLPFQPAYPAKTVPVRRKVMLYPSRRQPHPGRSRNEVPPPTGIRSQKQLQIPDKNSHLPFAMAIQSDSHYAAISEQIKDLLKIVT